MLYFILAPVSHQICRFFAGQTAAKIRCKRHMSETDEFVSASNEGFLMDPVSVATAYQKMKVLCSAISHEIRTDIDIHNQHILPRLGSIHEVHPERLCFFTLVWCS